jgi:hypothetical protein
VRREIPEQYAPDKPRLVDIAILTVLVEIATQLRKLTGSKRDKFGAPDINSAVALVELVLESLPAEDLTTAMLRQRLYKMAGADDSEMRKWNLHQGLGLSFQEAIERTDGRYNSMHHFVAMLERNGYPKRFLKGQFITQAALERALKLDSKRRQKQKLAHQEKQRTKQG